MLEQWPVVEGGRFLFLSTFACRLSTLSSSSLDSIVLDQPSEGKEAFFQMETIKSRCRPKNIPNTAFPCAQVITNPVSVSYPRYAVSRVNFAVGRLMKTWFNYGNFFFKFKTRF